jgi:hypothetical protein
LDANIGFQGNFSVVNVPMNGRMGMVLRNAPNQPGLGTTFSLGFNKTYADGNVLVGGAFDLRSDDLLFGRRKVKLDLGVTLRW